MLNFTIQFILRHKTQSITVMRYRGRPVPVPAPIRVQLGGLLAQKRDRHRFTAEGHQLVSQAAGSLLETGPLRYRLQPCQIEDTRMHRTSDSETSSKPTLTCRLHSEMDYNMCHSSHCYCQFSTDFYTGRSGCEWQTDRLRDYRRCTDRNLEYEAMRLGVNN
uniref:Thyroglobulin type-1 domain-containing protein n=1 Tax=Macrostomum lignano TaxID=282301 RepID=A0A1I8FMP7_9PLAT